MVTVQEIYFLTILSYFTLMSILIGICQTQIKECLNRLKKADAIAKQENASNQIEATNPVWM